MDPLQAQLILQLIATVGIPAARDIITLVRDGGPLPPTLDEWLAVLDKAQTHANAFLARTADVELPLDDPSTTTGTDTPATP